jgi:hypothetical protein
VLLICLYEMYFEISFLYAYSSSWLYLAGDSQKFGIGTDWVGLGWQKLKE